MGASSDANGMESGVSELHGRLITTTQEEPGQHLSRGRSEKSRLHRSRNETNESVGFLLLTILVVALGPLTSGFALGYTSPTQLAMMADLGLTVAEFSTFGSILNVGAMLGAIASGHIADYLGRRKALVVALVPEIVGWLLIVYGQTSTVLVTARVLVGLGVGLISFTVPVYIAEIAPKHLRGTLGTMNQLAFTLGIVLAYLGGLFVEWRTLAALGVLPEVILAVALLFIPESPRWLAKVGHIEELSASLQVLRGKDFNITNEIMDIQGFSMELQQLLLASTIASGIRVYLFALHRQTAVEASNSIPGVKWSDLTQQTLFRPLLVGIGLMILQQFGGINALMLYSSEIVETAGVKNPNVASLGLGTLQVFMTIAAAGLMDKAGRRILLMVSAGGMCLTSFLVGFSFYLRGLQSENSLTYIGILAFVSLLVYIASFSLGMGAIPWLIMSEIFPAHVKGVAGSVAALVNWLCSYLVTMLFNYLLLWSAAGSFWIFAAECLATVVFVALYVPETRGRTLEQIEASFK